jgi:hypothetical protein
VGQSKSTRWFADVDEDVRVQGSVGDLDQSVLEAVETVELEPPRSGVQQFRSATERNETTCNMAVQNDPP